MRGTSPEVDAYIAKSAPFAKPILKKLRRFFHEACPEIEEKIKWGVPSFEHKGMVGGFAAFKQHVDFGFWKGALRENKKALATFESFSTNNRNEYVEWMAQGKPRNWKYMK